MNQILDLIREFFRLFQWWVIIAPWEQAVRVRAGKHLTLLQPGSMGSPLSTEQQQYPRPPN